MSPELQLLTVNLHPDRLAEIRVSNHAGPAPIRAKGVSHESVDMLDMMVVLRRTTLSLICLLTLSIGTSAALQGQSQHPHIYTNMLGDWVGYSNTKAHGVVKHVPVEIKITEKKDVVQMNYVYSTRGQSDYCKYTKYMKLDPLHSEMTLWFDDSMSKDRYTAKGLSEFAQAGVGRFTATGAPVGPGTGNGMFIFDLDSETLSYAWLSQTQTGTYAPVSTYVLHRVDSAPAKP